MDASPTKRTIKSFIKSFIFISLVVYSLHHRSFSLLNYSIKTSHEPTSLDELWDLKQESLLLFEKPPPSFPLSLEVPLIYQWTSYEANMISLCNEFFVRWQYRCTGLQSIFNRRSLDNFNTTGVYQGQG